MLRSDNSNNEDNLDEDEYETNTEKDVQDLINYLCQLIENIEKKVDKKLYKSYDEKELLRNIDIKKFLPIIQKLADDDDDPKALHLLGIIYSYDIGINRDKDNDDIGLYYLTLSANQGYKYAEKTIYEMYDGHDREELIDRMCFYLVGNKLLKDKNKELEDEIEKLTTHIKCMPDGDVYFEAKEHYDKLSKKD